MAELTKEWLLKTITELEEERDAVPGVVNEDAANALVAMKLALASLEAEPVVWLLSGGGAKNNVSFDSGNAYADPLREVTPLYTAPPAPVSVPAAMEMDDDFDSAFEHGKAVGWNAYRAAMLQGADRPQNEPQNIPENIPATQFKPVADLYGLTSPTGGETSFTFDAVEARDFIDGGWSCQEYVELGRFQEAMLQNGNSPAQSDCCPAQNYIAPAQDGNSPVIPDCSCGTCRPVTFTDSRFVVCSECGNKRCPHANDHRNACTGSNEPGQEGRAYPAAPQQEVK